MCVGKEFAKTANLKSSSFSDAELREIITEVRQLWPQCIMVHGRPRHSQSQGAVERLNQIMQHKLDAWMVENDSKNWSLGLKFVRWAILSSETKGVKDMPYRLAYGQNPVVGLMPCR